KQKKNELNVQTPSGIQEIPIVKLLFIGVDNNYQFEGNGDYIMSVVLENSIQIASMSGCNLIVVESTDSAISFYEKFDFKHVRKENGYNVMAIGTRKLLNLN